MPDRDIEFASVVATFDAKAQVLKLPDLPVLESTFETTANVEPILSDAGAGRAVRLRRHRLDVLLLPNRIEIVSQEPVLDNPLTERMALATSHAAGLFPSGIWRLMGYNFVYVWDADQPAMQVIGKRLLSSKDLSDKINHNILGGAASLWMEMGDSILLLRVEPRGMDRVTKKIWLNANFTANLDGEIPATEAITSSIQEKHSQLKEILGTVGVW